MSQTPTMYGWAVACFSAALLAFSSPALAFPPPLPEEETHFVKLMAALKADQDIGLVTIAAAAKFLGRPYVAGSLNVTNDPELRETLVCRFDAFDCVTLVETSLAMARARTRSDSGWKRFRSELETLRYRGGQREGYASRLHYFTEWIRDNDARGIVKDLTPALGGEPVSRPLNFMSRHRKAYGQLLNDEVWAQVRETERVVSRRPRSVIPKNRLPAVVPMLQSGDILAFATGVEGLDVAHVGLAIRKDDGVVYLLHAPEKGQPVQISKKPLLQYILGIAGHTGLMIARPQAVDTSL
ncbi:MAG: N-acetylmuramoyl-L-alanine amidase-like domain-containing protein [Candidatus Sericytochromatia bacterium]|nr:N-acetylmuramoyl-L-alanine amidase-like domain-containing protein [Candidatus Sericytochromatia bacterium]